MWRSILGMVALAGWASSAAAAPIACFEVESFPMFAPADTADSVAGNDVISESDLGGMAGGMDVGDLQINTATNNNTSTNNTVSGNVTTGGVNGTNVQNVSGFNTIMLNTGNNVTMQNTTQVNIILK